MPTPAGIVVFVFQLFQILILIRVLLSWIYTNPYSPALNNPAVRILYQVTDPILEPIRKVIPPIGGAIDISPIVALLLLDIVRRILVSFLMGL
jgi:YggT family protein